MTTSGGSSTTDCSAGRPSDASVTQWPRAGERMGERCADAVVVLDDEHLDH